MFHVYILQSDKDKTFYTGICSNIQERLTQHNQSVTKTTRSKKPWKLVHSEAYETRLEARKREKFLKSGAGREERKRLLA
jgi:putative endonuclease